MAEELIPEPIVLKEWHKAWLLNELAKPASDQVAIRAKYKRVFKEDLHEVVLQGFVDDHRADIEELAKSIKGEVEGHPMADPFRRLNTFQEIKEMALEGVCVGIDKQGDPVIAVNLQAALNATKECREEIKTIRQHELDLLKMILEQAKRTETKAPKIEVKKLDEIGEAPTPNITIQTDTDQYFEDDEE